MSIDSHSETDNDQLENPVIEKKNNKWRIKVETEEIEKLEQYVKNVRDSKVFRFSSKEMSEILNPIMSVESVASQGNALVLDVSIDNDQFATILMCLK